MKIQYNVLFLVIILVSCTQPQVEKPVSPTSINMQTETENMHPSRIQDVTSPIPAQSAKMERWMKYEHALSLELLGTTDAICEWEVLGQDAGEVYVWAECQINYLTIGTATSVPAVLYLGKNGSIENVQIPGDGTRYEIDIRNMFPPELLERIFSMSVETEAMWSHLQLRHKTPEPPLSVLSGRILP
jgi:hypothetical protein